MLARDFFHRGLPGAAGPEPDEPRGVKRNRFIALDGATKSVNRGLEAKARDLAGIKGYVTNLATCPDGTA
jgi:hypothetical protein